MKTNKPKTAANTNANDVFEKFTLALALQTGLNLTRTESRRVFSFFENWRIIQQDEKLKQIKTLLDQTQNNNIKMWQEIKKLNAKHNTAIEKIEILKEKTQWHTGAEIPTQRDGNSNFSVEVLAIVNLQLAPQDYYHAVYQYDYKGKYWLDENSIQVQPPQYWQYIADPVALTAATESANQNADKIEN